MKNILKVFAVILTLFLFLQGIENYKNYCISAGLDYKNEESLENYLDWTRNAIEWMLFD